MATGVMSSGGGAGVSAKIAVRGLALRRRETRRIGQQKSLEKLSQFCACQQCGQGCHSGIGGGTEWKLFFNKIKYLCCHCHSEFGRSGAASRRLPRSSIPQRKTP
jgi:hypothetical protein